MKRLFFTGIFLISLAITLPHGTCYAQNKKLDVIIENKKFREELNKEFRDTMETPLTAKGLKTFKKLDFFPVRTEYKVKAKLLRRPDEVPFEMPRSKGNTGTYRKYGEAIFNLHGKEYKLNVYQYMKLINDEKNKNYLFLPFTDLTNGKQTNETGRFLDLEILNNDEIIIDFNKAYNPLCAYGNPKYSCPIPPKENHLEVKIKAGVKKYIE